MKQKEIIYGKMSGIKMKETAFGRIGDIFQKWGKLRINGFLIEIEKAVGYNEWSVSNVENLCIVEDGSGIIEFNGNSYDLEPGTVFKVFPRQTPLITPKDSVKIFSVQMETTLTEFSGENLEMLQVKKSKDIPQQVYEYEALAQEYITPEYENGLGLLRFTFPINNIPIHIHPHSDRIIRPVSHKTGKGFTFADPNRYEMNENTFCMFPEGTKHTNGPLPGEVYDVWAVQLPWIPSKIDKENIAGDDKFVKYVESVPPKALWKTTQGLKEAVKKLRGGKDDSPN